MDTNKELVARYAVAAPRYTSYPTVPAWVQAPTQAEWKAQVKACFKKTNSANGISLYIHLPFCESLCTYCACNTRITVNHKVEAPYIAAVLKEWGLYRALFNEAPRIKEIHLGGGTPTFFSPQHLHELVSGILGTSEICVDFDFSFEGHPGNTSPEHLQVLYNLGFRRVSFGIQDFDVKVQDAIHRRQSFKEVEQAVAAARSIGYTSINFDLVYGLPFQKQDTLEDTLQKVNLLKPDRIAFYSYAHVPWLKPGQRKFTEKDLPLPVEKRLLYEKGLAFFTANDYEDVGMDHFALKQDDLYLAKKNKTLHRNFMGYTCHYTELAIGLGASAISDTWTAFLQNIKTVEEYQEAVNGGLFPVFKGHLLTAEDKMLRRQILNLMCQHQTAWCTAELNCPALPAALNRCKEMEEDGLLSLSPQMLKINEKGKPFLRNICMCFDAHYWLKPSAANVFSLAG